MVIRINETAQLLGVLGALGTSGVAPMLESLVFDDLRKPRYHTISVEVEGAVDIDMDTGALPRLRSLSLPSHTLPRETLAGFLAAIGPSLNDLILLGSGDEGSGAPGVVIDLLECLGDEVRGL
jgi:hypothetical protein